MAGIKWTPEELDYIKENNATLTIKQMATHLGRTEKAVRNTRNSLGLENKGVEVGEVYGELTVLALEMRKHGSQNKTFAHVKCTCGREAWHIAAKLKSGYTTLCGKDHYSHHAGTLDNRIYRIWCGMRNRCNNPNNEGYDNYGGRGIKVCDEWDKFSAFYYWAMSNGYTDELTLDRIDVNGNYEPTNCKWKTYKYQNNNKRSNVNLIAWDETKTLTEWLEDDRCKANNINAIQYRLSVGYTPEEAISKEKGDNKDLEDNINHTYYSKLHNIWSGAKRRCNNPNAINYNRYGGVGIKWFDGWDKYEDFKEWALSSGYQAGLTLDRIDSLKNYGPDNCKWSTTEQQANNKRNSRIVEAFGETKTVAQWAKDSRCNITVQTLHKRLDANWNVETAITEPPLKIKSKGEPLK